MQIDIYIIIVMLAKAITEKEREIDIVMVTKQGATPASSSTFTEHHYEPRFLWGVAYEYTWIHLSPSFKGPTILNVESSSFESSGRLPLLASSKGPWCRRSSRKWKAALPPSTSVA